MTQPLAAVRTAVRAALAELDPGSTVLVACSGGADSTALLAAAVAEAREGALVVVAVTVDHGLQEGSATRAEEVVALARTLGAQVAEAIPVQVGVGQGPEAAARRARYDALDEAADRHRAAVVLLGHTRDDQAETVLLGLARGSGSRSLAGMRPRHGRYVRPLLGLSRAQTEAACVALGVQPWHDPHNADPAYTRARVRQRVLPLLEAELGPGVAAALARTADQFRADNDLLDELAEEAYHQVEDDAGLDTEALEKLPGALRSRVLRRAALKAGAIPADLTHGHLSHLDALVTDWHGQRWIDLPGPVRAARREGRIVMWQADAHGSG
ncbi:tRNA lysidine(34) synthetase TilS [Nocardioides limicola]|uniref:tRNA lysidine(34) synthetase TilS n=1 Tax=Nocardioides limicola TaxID=2803368 RepID=UPI0027DD2B30|nr:tRNA lysidine(34) synthetase TilS [Nocardioides sp. DJM-14]